MRNNAKDSSVQIGDTVLVKKDIKENKLSVSLMKIRTLSQKRKVA